MPADASDDEAGWRRVLQFWFEDTPAEKRFAKDSAFDAEIRTRFLETHRAVRRGECFLWRREALGRLAEIIVLDQFSRNMFRDQPEAFASDSLALILAQEAVRQKCDLEMPDPQYQAFMYLPYMHSESPLIHEEAMRLFSQPGLERPLDYEKQHKRIIDRFGRYPHRNAILGRNTTKEEAEFLKEEGSSF